MKPVDADWREELAEIIKARELSRREAAELLRVSEHTVIAWLKPDTSKGHNRVPLWAVELLCLKTGHPMPPVQVHAA